MSDEQKPVVIREVAGAFFELDVLQDAVEELLASGFKRESISMLAGEHKIGDELGDYYTRVNQFSSGPDAPQTAFVANEAMGDTMHALFGSLYFLGATIAAGAVVATAGAMAGAISAAMAGTVAIGSIGAILAGIVHESDAEEIEQQIDEGHLVLFVRTRNVEQEKLAVEIMQRHAGTEVKVYSVKADVLGYSK